MSKTNSICLDCLYGNQPFSYYPIICVRDEKHIIEMQHEKKRCKHFKPCPTHKKQEEQKPQKPWQMIKCK